MLNEKGGVSSSSHPQVVCLTILANRLVSSIWITQHMDHSKLSRLPKRKCCVMGTLESTSTWYIFIIPLFTCMATVHQQSARPSASPGERLSDGADPADVQMLCLRRTISTQ